MRIETPQSPIEQPAKLQSIEDIQFELVVEGDPDFETAVSVINENGEQPEDKLRDAAKREVVRINWWLQEQWASKGLPKEQVSIKVANLAIEIYNYGQELSTSQIEEAKRVIAMLSQASIPEQDSRIKYVAINDTDEMNDQNGENKRGYAFPASKMVALYPRAVSPEPHRIPDISSFAGTLVHEIGHIYSRADFDFLQEWQKRFGWEVLPNEQVDWQKPISKIYATNQPHRCITDYAQFSPDEDICESLSAVVNNPTVLDPERRAFIEERWFKQKPTEVEVSSERKVGTHIQMPKVADKIKYKTRIAEFTMGTIKKDPSIQTE